MLKVASDNPYFLALVSAFKHNTKFQFDASIGLWSISVRSNFVVAERIIELVDVRYPLVIKRTNKQIFIYDSDVLLNRKFLKIFAPVPKDATQASLGITMKPH